jgi:hypothetical protein
VSENEVLSKVFKPRKDDIGKQFKILHNKVLCDLYRSHSTVMVVKLRGLPWSGHVAIVG